MGLLYDLLGFELANLKNIAEKLLGRCAIDAHMASKLPLGHQAGMNADLANHCQATSDSIDPARYARRMVSEPDTAAELAHEIVRSRDGIAAVAQRCSPEQWCTCPLRGDPRPVGVVIDHVADSYRYMGRWIRQLVAGEPIEVSAEIIDALNAGHAEGAASATKEEVVNHLQECGDGFASLIRSLPDADLDRGDGRVRRFALIAIRHADDHGAEIETGLQSTVPHDR